MRLRALAFVAAAAALAAACNPPPYVSYRSVSGDFTVSAPWGWDVLADAQYDAFSQVTFIGPFDKDFYLGAPTLTVRWFKPFRPHAIRNGFTEMYTSSSDFIKQTLNDVYGKDALVFGPSSRPLDQRVAIDRKDIPTITLNESGLDAKYFGVLSPTPATSGVTIGVVTDKDGRRINQRYHEYAVVPILVDGREAGFYVLTYPATVGGHDKGMDRFQHLIGSFHPYTAGPGGPKIVIPGPRRKSPL
ncbi:MAG TPA: hypothetical protein VN915_07925 [Elusimicrobiota bacterium]|nr:hypothetical protein [Elusimicrobiota bacterium]